MKGSCLIITPEYPPMVIGGPGHHMYHLASGLAQNGWKITVVCFHRGPTISWASEAGVSVIRVPVPSLLPADYVAKYLYQSDWIEHSVDPREIVDSPKKGLVISQGYFLGRVARRWAIALNWPLITHSASLLSTSFEAPVTDKQFMLQEERSLYQAGAVTIAPSEWLRNEICRLCNVDPTVVRVIPKAIRIASFQPWHEPPGEPIITYIGRLSPEKGVHVLVQAMADVVRDVPKAKLRLVGVASDGEYLQLLRSLIYKYDLNSSIFFWGGVAETDLPSIYQSTQIVAIPSIHESFGRVAIEAMAAGRPVVASAIEGLEEVVKADECGVLVPVNDPSQLAAAVVDLLLQPLQAVEIGKRAADKVKRYDWDQVLPETELVYRKVLNHEL